MKLLQLILLVYAASLQGEQVDKVNFEARLRLSGQHLSHSLEKDALLNPDNRVLNLPKTINRLNVLPEVKLATDKFDLIYRPLIKTERALRTTKTTLDTREFFGEAVLSEQATFLLGIKNDQWGPAESLSPTNKIFRETILQKDPFHEQMGLYLARLNFALPWNLTVSTLAEIGEVPGRERSELEKNEFIPKGLVRLEWNMDADLLGFVGGNTERGESWVGEYFSVRFFDRLSVYAEARHERGSRGWYPLKENSAAPVTFRQKREAQQTIDTLGGAGLRYETDEQTDFRFEYIENTFGYSESEKELLQKALDKQDPLQLRVLTENYQHALLSDLDLRGRRYLYFSFRSRDALWLKDLTLFARSLHSLADKSYYVLGGFEYAVNDHAVVTAFASRSQGRGSDDLASPVSSSQGISLSYSF